MLGDIQNSLIILFVPSNYWFGGYNRLLVRQSIRSDNMGTCSTYKTTRIANSCSNQYSRTHFNAALRPLSCPVLSKHWRSTYHSITNYWFYTHARARKHLSTLRSQGNSLCCTPQHEVRLRLWHSDTLIQKALLFWLDSMLHRIQKDVHVALYTTTRIWSL